MLLLKDSALYCLTHRTHRILVQHMIHNRRAIRQDAQRLNSRRSFSHTRQPELDLEYLTNPLNKAEIQRNIDSRKGIGNISNVVDLFNRYSEASDAPDPQRNKLRDQLIKEALKIPNRCDQKVHSHELPRLVELKGAKPEFSFIPLELHEICKPLGLLRTENLGLLTGHRSYYFLDRLAMLEQALIQFTVDQLKQKGFILYSVPDLLDESLIESCGMDTRGERTQVGPGICCIPVQNHSILRSKASSWAQVYRLNGNSLGDNICLSGTAEMALASYFAGKTLPLKNLPLQVAAVSRCFRAETSSVAEEKGIYRRVEMSESCRVETMDLLALKSKQWLHCSIQVFCYFELVPVN